MARNRKTRAAMVLVALTGLRLETLGNYWGTDGLRIRDLPEIRISEGRIEFEKVPTMVVVRGELNKGGHK